jgi:hypothetical protein
VEDIWEKLLEVICRNIVELFGSENGKGIVELCHVDDFKCRWELVRLRDRDV